jgi:hypothetical protein
MADNGENILVEFDYDNITLIDPNKLVDQDGNVKERLVKQEDLVYYANLECNVLPRTKLAVGTAMNDQQRTISVGKINFLNPGHKTFMDTAWSDEITGKDSVQGKGVNQINQTAVKNPNKSDDFYITQNLNSNGTPGAVDNGFLGMRSVNVSIGLDFLPVITVELEDVKGRALFEGGNNSPYAAFFQLPYPQFTLTLKGYYGKAVKFPIMLQSFTSKFDPSTHNFIINLKFYGYKYTLLSYVNFGALMAVPHMYNNTVTQTPVTIEQGTTSNATTATAPIVVSRGYQKMKEIYSNYKSKGLIPDDFPEITLNQLKYRLQRFIDEVLEQFTKENMGVLTTMTDYTNTLLTYQQKVFLFTTSWYNTYMDIKNPIILKSGQKVYTFKKDLNAEKIGTALTELDGILKDYNTKLNENKVFGVGGSYTIGTKTEQTQIPFNITVNTVRVKVNPDQVDSLKTYQAQENSPKGTLSPAGTPVVQLTKFDIAYEGFINSLKNTFVTNDNTFNYFEGVKSFMEITDDMAKQAAKYRTQIEQQITTNLAEKFNSRGSGGLGFIPSVRNILAVFYCQGEAFLRLLDEVHKKAWDQRENEYRRAAIFGNQTTAPSVDIKTSTQNNEPIYPWPQVIQETVGDDGKEKFELIYPGAQNVASSYRAYSPEVWPEVEFVEQFIKGYTERQKTDDKEGAQFNELNNQPSRASLNAIEFPVSNEVFQNKEESKYFFEIYERLMLNSYYSKLNRKSGYDLSIYEAESDDEAVNVIKSLGADNPFLSKKIKEYLLDSNNYLPFLRHISNQGQGESWQTFAKGTFVTPYIRNDVENPNVIYNSDILISTKSQPNVSLSNPRNLTNLEKYLTSTSNSNVFDFTDVYPLTDLNWDRNNLANGKSLNNANEAFDTKDVLEYNDTHKTITNFENDDNSTTKRPYTYFNFENLSVTPDTTNLKTFYNTRSYKNQLVTEGNLKYTGYTNNLTETQTTSMLNTPYFINAVQQGVFNFRYKQNDPYPYKTAAYLFLNSLPLATLREKYVTKNGESTTDLSYILATMKKFGAVHKLPYAWILKYGSIWNRYKTYKETGVDYLDSVWKNFNYLENWDPATSSTTKNYDLVIDGTPRNLVLDTTTGTQPFTDINTGFYPQLVDDFNVFLQGLKLFSGSSQTGGNCTIQNISGNSTVFEVTGTCSPNSSTIIVNSITNNLIQVGSTITIQPLGINLLVTGQVSGTSGGTGTYNITPGFSSNTPTFNFTIGGFAQISNVNLNSLTNGIILSGSSYPYSLTLGNQISGTTNSNGLYKVNNVGSFSSNFVALNPPLQINSIDSNVLVNGSVINGPLLNGNVTIGNQISGTTGGIGLYVIGTGQTLTTSAFVVQNSYTQGIPSSSIQSNLDSGKIMMMNTTNSTIYETPGFDPSNPVRTMRVSPWSVVVSSSTEPNFYYVMPSFGTNINQTKDEAFKNGQMKTELSGNNAMFNGSVRLFWNAPQYGWFDNSKVIKNDPETYLKTILNEQKDQQNFIISGDKKDYTNFEELFTTFNTKTLDYFESEFLNFSRSIYDFVETLPSFQSTTDLTISKKDQQGLNEPNSFESQLSEQTFKNFQTLARQLFKVTAPTGTSPETKLSSLITNQNQTFQNILTSFMNYDVVFRYGNPSEFNKRLFYTFSTRFIEDPIIYGSYFPGSLPTQGGGVTLAQSKQQNPKTWEALEYYIGKSSIPKLAYTDNGSYITDFFVDLNVLFNEKNVKDFAPLIKIYATQKLANPNLNYTSFYGLMDDYITESDNYINNVLNVMLPAVRKQLPNVFITEDNTQTRADLEAGFTEQTRTELWETFKALNDSWIAGFDFESKTLFEDVMLVDRASRNVGDKVLVDIFQIMDLIDGANYKNTLLDMVTTILVQNNFQHFMLPAYVNFYNVQDVQKNPTPRPDGSLEFGNTLFGTFLNVDYRNSSPKFLCYYASKPSEHLDMKDNIDYRYRDDAFDLRRASDNPLIENQIDKQDWAKSNKVVGFNVDMTRQNQQIFKSFSVAQDPGKPTSESLEMLNQMANLDKNRRSTTQSVSLYNLYKNRSYTCSVDMMGDALIQPMMYFNIRNIPMFSGPYMITKVSHSVSENGFETQFEGTRQPFYSLPRIDNFVQTLNVKILSTIQSKIQERETKLREGSDNVQFQRNNVLANIQSQETLTKNQDCQTNINPKYFQYTAIDNPIQTSQTTKELFNTIVEVLKINNVGNITDTKFQIYANILFTFIYVDTGNSSKITGYENNYSTINLKEFYGPSFTNYINKKFYCVKRGNDNNLPVASFTSFQSFVEFAFNRIVNILGSVESDIKSGLSTEQTYAKQYVLNYPINQPTNVYTSLVETNEIKLIEAEFVKAINVFKSVQTFTTN